LLKSIAQDELRYLPGEIVSGLIFGASIMYLKGTALLQGCANHEFRGKGLE
jgi:hypothetical protein